VLKEPGRGLSIDVDIVESTDDSLEKLFSCLNKFIFGSVIKLTIYRT
jgi:hypothetical protein